MPRAKLIVVSLAALAAGIAVIVLSRETALPSATQAARLQKVGTPILASNDPRWVEQASREPTRIEFAKRVDGPPSAEVETLGRLDAAGKTRLQQLATNNMRNLYEVWEKQCSEPGTNPDGKKSLRNAIAEMEHLYLAKRAEVEMDLINRDEYLTFAAEGKSVNKATIPGGYTAMRTYNGGTMDGVAVDVLVLVPEDDARLKPVMDEIKKMRDVSRDHDIAEFNALSEEERRTRISQHEKALAEIRELNLIPNFQGSAKEQQLQEVYKKLLPYRWHYTTGFLAYQSPESER